MIVQMHTFMVHSTSSMDWALPVSTCMLSPPSFVLTAWLVGPLIGGQIYGHLRRGWTAICLLLVGLVALDAVFTTFYTGDQPLMRRIFTSKPRLQESAEGTQEDELHV